MGTRTVLIISAAAYAPITALVTKGLHHAGLDTVSPPSKADAGVVMLSRDSLAEVSAAHLLANVQRLIPVVLGPLPPGSLPESLASINWVVWNHADPRSSVAEIVKAAASDLSDYGTARSLEAKASAWLASDKSPDELLLYVKDVRVAERAIGRGDISGEIHPSDLQAYVDASRRFATRRRRMSRMRVALSAVLMVTGLVFAFELVQDLRAATTRNKLELVANEPNGVSRPEVQAIKAAALLVDRLAEGSADTGVAASVARLLSSTWPTAVIGAESEMAVNDAAPYANGSKAWIASGSSRLVRWDVHGDRILAELATESPVYSVVTTADGESVLASDATTVMAVHSGKLTRIEMEASQLDIASDGRSGVASTEGTAVALTMGPSGISAGQPTTWDGVLDVAVIDGAGPAALVRDGEWLAVIDLVGGRPVWRQQLPTSEFYAGALSRTGGVVLSANRGLWWRPAGVAELRRTPHASGDVILAMDVTREGQVFLATSARGVFGFDLNLGVALPEPCQEAAVVRDLRVSPDEDLLACVSQGFQSFWRIERPAAPMEDQAPQLSALGAGGLERVEISDPGGVAVQVNGGQPLNSYTVRTQPNPPDDVSEHYFLPGGVILKGEFTTVAAHPDSATFVLGSSAGEVVELDVMPNGLVALDRVWTAPDGAPIRSLKYSGESITATTRSASWSFPSCAECGRDPIRLIDRVVERQLPCYPHSISELIPEDQRSSLRIKLCIKNGL